MLVIICVRRLDNERIEVGVARPQHDLNPIHNYPSEKEVLGDPVGFWDQQRDNRFSPQVAGTDGYRRTIKIPSDGCSAERIAVWKISIVDTKGGSVW